MAVTTDDLQEVAKQLLDAIAVYDQFVEGWPYESEPVPDEVERFLSELDGETAGSGPSVGVVLAAGIKEMYHEAREAEAAYVERARQLGRSDWSRIVAETEPVRKAARRVHTAGYGVDPETGKPDYVLPEKCCPASLVSMNDGSSPVTYQDRISQYRTVADRLDFSPEVVYHPGSGHDVSPSKAFPESRVVYVDVDEAAMADLDCAGYEAVGSDATGYELAGGADVLIFRNAGLTEEAIVAANLRPGGWVLANDHLESARHLARLESLELVGVVPDDWTGTYPPVETSGLDPYRSRFEADSRSSATKGTPLDLYVFRNDT